MHPAHKTVPTQHAKQPGAQKAPGKTSQERVAVGVAHGAGKGGRHLRCAKTRCGCCARCYGAVHGGGAVGGCARNRWRTPCVAAPASHGASLTWAGIGLHGHRPDQQTCADKRTQADRSRRGFTVFWSPANSYAPAVFRASVRNVGASVPKRNTRSSANVMEAKISSRFPARVKPATGSAICPSRIIKPEAPRL